MSLRQLAGAAAVAGLLLASAGAAAAQQLKGVIQTHDGNKLVVQANGMTTPITLTDTTVIQQVSGALGLQKEDHPASDLIKGLNVNIDTVLNGTDLTASKVTFSPNDLKIARAIATGTEDAKQKIIAADAENKRVQAEAAARQADAERRLALVGQFSEKAQAKVYFDSGKTTINADGAEALRSIAQQAQAIPGSLVRVVGHADSVGNAKANQRLSNQRASAVTAYLLKNAGLPPEKIATAGGLGSYVPVENEEPGKGSAANRRVTVFVLVSKASEMNPDLKPASTGSVATVPSSSAR
jgi:outer membrane protein OmpA-like peptidoglycan-associated protein